MKLKDISFYKNKFIYKVEEGDSLNVIAEKFHTTVAVIIVDNGLTEPPERGRYIIINKVAGEKKVVKPMENLEKIAGGKDKVFEICAKNKINEVYVGQILYV